MKSPPTHASTPVSVAAAPLWAVMSLSFADSMVTGVVGNAIFAITKHGYHFSQLENYALAVLMGGVYILGAWGVGPIMRTLKRSFGLSSRGFLVFITLGMFSLCAIPQIAVWLTPAGQPLPRLPIWICTAAYNLFNGFLWPVVESYLSGGRSGHGLRRALGLWSVAWSFSLVVASLCIAPLVQDHAILAILLLGSIHLVTLFIIPALNPEPTPHVEEHHEPHPPIYTKLLVTFRMLLPMSYAVLSAMSPFIPEAAERLGLGAAGQTTIAIAWLLPRCLGFALFDRWHGWHGRWLMPGVGGVLLMAGFAATFLAPRLATGNAGLAIFIAGLSVFGVAISAIYTGAIYYAMSVGKAEVEAGGTHEALIGVGYTVGPACGLAASLGVDRGVLKATTFEPLVVSAVGLIGVVVTVLVLRRISRVAETPGTDPNPNAPQA